MSSFSKVLLLKEFGFVHLSAGELLREEQKSGSENGELIDTYIREGKIVPVEITVNLLDNVSSCKHLLTLYNLCVCKLNLNS